MSILTTIGERLKYLRKDVIKLNQTDFAEKLKISQSFFAQLEKNQRNFTDRTIADICREFNVNENWLRTGEGNIFDDDVKTEIDAVCEKYNFSTLERTILENFARKSAVERKSFLDFAMSLVDVSTSTPLENKENTPPSELPHYTCIIDLPLYTQKASAGLGNYFTVDDDDYTMQAFNQDDVPPGTEFCIIADGDSMEPLIKDGQTLFIKPAISIENKQIGIFILDNEVLCKKLVIDYENSLVILRSLNDKYADIIVHEHAYLKTIGQVLL